MNTLSKLQLIFNEIQTCDSKKYGDCLKEALQLIPIDNSFLRIIDACIAIDKPTQPPKIVYFIKRIFEEQSQNNKMIFKSILNYLVDKLTNKNTKIRKNTLRLLGVMFWVDPSILTPELLEKIAERLFDKEQSVRKEALKICLPYQSQALNDSLTIQATIKDMIRYDQSHEIRKLGFLGLELNSSSLNCILERCIDSNVYIRKAFWNQYFNKIDLSILDHCQRIYLMKKGMNEREFDAKATFLDKIRHIGLKSFIDYFYCEDNEYERCLHDLLLENTDEFYLDSYTPSYLNFLTFYYKIREERDGRDALKLIDLDEFLQIFYFKCKELLNNEQTDKELEYKVLRYLLRILRFYDIFTDDAKKYVFSIINHLSAEAKFNPIAEEYVSLGLKISGDKSIGFIGNLIKKTKNTGTCLLICEFAMKHMPYSELFDAILSEVVIFNIETSYNIFFWYLIKNYKKEVEEQYLNFLPNKRVLEGAADLVLSNVLEIDKIECVLHVQLGKLNNSAVLPVCKLLLAQKINNIDFVKYLLIIFYSTHDDVIQQYLALFFFEFFRIDTKPLVNVFCQVLEIITNNHRIFIDQSIFWISHTGLGDLYFQICVYIANNHDTLVNKKHLFNTLAKINVTDNWNKILIKKIIVLLGIIIRKRPRENVHSLINSFLEKDDGIPLPNEEFDKLKNLVNFE